MAEATTAGPNADRLRARQIVAWHAQGHDLLDEYGIPRFDGKDAQGRNVELSIRERIERLAEQCGAQKADQPVARLCGFCRRVHSGLCPPVQDV